MYQLESAYLIEREIGLSGSCGHCENWRRKDSVKFRPLCFCLFKSRKRNVWGVTWLIWSFRALTDAWVWLISSQKDFPFSWVNSLMADSCLHSWGTSLTHHVGCNWNGSLLIIFMSICLDNGALMNTSQLRPPISLSSLFPSPFFYPQPCLFLYTL